MLWGSILMGLFLAVAAGLDYFVLYYSKSGESPNSERAKWFGIATAAVIFIYTAVFGSTWITAGWLYPTEVCHSPFSSPLVIFFLSSLFFYLSFTNVF